MVTPVGSSRCTSFLGMLITLPPVSKCTDICCRGFGNGLVQSAGFIALTSTIDRSRVAMVSSTWFLSGNTGSVIGTAATNAVIQSTLRRYLNAELVNFPDKTKVGQSVTLSLLFPDNLLTLDTSSWHAPYQIIKRSLSDINYIQSLEGELKEIVVGAYTRSLGNSHRKFFQLHHTTTWIADTILLVVNLGSAIIALIAVFFITEIPLWTSFLQSVHLEQINDLNCVRILVAYFSRHKLPHIISYLSAALDFWTLS